MRPPLAVFMPDRLALVKGPPAGRRTHLDGFCAALWPAATRAAAPLLPGAGAAQRAARPDPGRRRLDRDPRRLGPGARDRGDRADRDPRRGGRPARPGVRRPQRALGLARDAALRYRPRSEADRRRPTLAAELGERRESDVARGYTGWGPHHDELAIELGGRSLRRYGSQGQQRAAPAGAAVRRARGAARRRPPAAADAARRRHLASSTPSAARCWSSTCAPAAARR